MGVAFGGTIIANLLGVILLAVLMVQLGIESGAEGALFGAAALRMMGKPPLLLDFEAVRDDENFADVFAWEHHGDGAEPQLHREPLVFESVHLATRSYK